MKLRLLAIAAALLGVAACSSAKHYEMRGQILGINRDKLEILVKHEEIAGLMPAMTMPWRVQSAGMLDNLGPGDLITSTIEVSDNQGVVTSITKLGTAKPDVPPAAAPAKPGVKYLLPGDQVPNQQFVDQDGRARPLSDIRGDRALAVTFIYTKCPVPTFCPMMDRQFAATQSLIKTRALGARAGLLSVSFDPKNDTPPVLKQHAQKLEADPAIWTFATASREEVDVFATNLGLTLVRGEAADPDEIGHTLRTAIIDREGRLAKAFAGADWTPEQLVDEMQKLP
jgi:protein SCO1/2